MATKRKAKSANLAKEETSTRNERDEIQKNAEKECMFGVVANCSRLNIRREPSIESDVVRVIEKSVELLIDPDNSTDEWYKVYTKGGLVGFCMKKYVVIK